MGIAAVLRKVFLVDLMQGLGVTFRYQDPKEIYTEQYPLERPQVAERYRGAPRLNVNPDTDETFAFPVTYARWLVRSTLLLSPASAMRRPAARSSPTSPTT